MLARVEALDLMRRRLLGRYLKHELLRDVAYRISPGRYISVIGLFLWRHILLFGGAGRELQNKLKAAFDVSPRPF